MNHTTIDNMRIFLAKRVRAEYKGQFSNPKDRESLAMKSV